MIAQDQKREPTVRAIRLQNFMAFEDTNWVELRPVTLLFGRNSHGKSVIIRALRLLRQSLDATPEEGALRFVSERGLDQGRFRDTLHLQAQSTDGRITFGFRVEGVVDESLRQEVNYWRAARGLEELSSEAVFERGWTWADLLLTFVWDKRQQRPELQRVAMECPWAVEGKNQGGLLFALERQDKNASSPDDPLGVELEDEWRGQRGILWDSELIRTLRPYLTVSKGFLPSLSQSGEMSPQSDVARSRLEVVGGAVDRFLRESEHIGPIRPEAQRAYLLTSLAQRQYRNMSLSAFYQFLLGSGDDRRFERMGKWLEQLGLGTEITFGPEQKERGRDERSGAEVRSVWVHDAPDNSVNLKDVGFGASQVVPVIAQCLSADHGQLVVIEQPELHLHPSAQARLADLFIEIALEGRARFLLETHSEHLLLRMRRRVAETTAGTAPDATRIDADSVAAYFVDRHAGRSFVQRVHINSLGSFENVPGGFKDFFTDDMTEVLELSKAARSAKAGRDE